MINIAHKEDLPKIYPAALGFMLKNNFYRPVVLKKVVHMLLHTFLQFVIFLPIVLHFANLFYYCNNKADTFKVLFPPL